MCGIAGLLKTSGSVTGDEIIAMADAMAHRGPDSWGYAYGDTLAERKTAVVHGDGPAPADCNLALGHRRLSIIDLSSQGNQPMSWGQYTIVYNGEIYNYIELGRELAGLGHAFASHSDTEVLLHAWAEWGAACIQKLNGIFAFLLWDARSRSLFAVRDRCGIKPLYYFIDPDQAGFASEIKALLAVRKGRPAPDERLIYDFLAAGRMDHEDATMFQGIRRIPAGCYMEMAASGTSVHRYWRIDENKRITDLSFSEASSRFHDLFHDAIRLQMRADVPVACCLSGGLDSSSVVSVASGLSDYRMSVFTARFDDPSMDEWNWAQNVHRAKPVDPVEVAAGPDSFWSDLPALIKSQEEPIANPGIYAQWCVMKAIRERGIKVTLDGQGGDELLCGYAKFWYWSLKEFLQRGDPLLAGASALGGLLLGGPQLFNWAGAKRYLPWGLGGKQHGPQLLQAQFARRNGSRTSRRGPGGTRVQQVLDVSTYSLPVLLRYEDKNSMAHSVEARVPFLDHRLVEFCIALPTEMKVRGSWSKRVLRQGLAGDVPKKILDRRSKLGFGGNFTSWVRALQPKLRDFAADESRPVFKIVNPDACRRYIEEENAAVFRLAALDAWLAEFNIDVRN